MDFNFKTKIEEKNVVNQMTVFNSQEVDTKKQPMFFGAPLGIQRYDTYKYPIFDKLTQQQLGYFWRPEEISLQKDRGDYQTLRPEQKHIFTSIARHIPKKRIVVFKSLILWDNLLERSFFRFLNGQVSTRWFNSVCCI